MLYELGWQTLSGAISPSDTVAALQKARTSDSSATQGENKEATAAADVLVRLCGAFELCDHQHLTISVYRRC